MKLDAATVRYLQDMLMREGYPRAAERLERFASSLPRADLPASPVVPSNVTPIKVQ